METKKRDRMTERFIIDDAGTLIDMQTRDTYDYVSDVCSLLNELHEEKCECENEIARLEMIISKLKDKDYDNHIKKIQTLSKENNEFRILITTLKEQNQKFKARLNDLGVEYL